MHTRQEERDGCSGVVQNGAAGQLQTDKVPAAVLHEEIQRPYGLDRLRELAEKAEESKRQKQEIIKNKILITRRMLKGVLEIELILAEMRETDMDARMLLNTKDTDHVLTVAQQRQKWLEQLHGPDYLGHPDPDIALRLKAEEVAYRFSGNWQPDDLSYQQITEQLAALVQKGTLRKDSGGPINAFGERFSVDMGEQFQQLDPEDQEKICQNIYHAIKEQVDRFVVKPTYCTINRTRDAREFYRDGLRGRYVICLPEFAWRLRNPDGGLEDTPTTVSNLNLDIERFGDPHDKNGASRLRVIGFDREHRSFLEHILPKEVLGPEEQGVPDRVECPSFPPALRAILKQDRSAVLPG